MGWSPIEVFERLETNYNLDEPEVRIGGKKDDDKKLEMWRRRTHGEKKDEKGRRR
jgi:hypothetical protein